LKFSVRHVAGMGQRTVPSKHPQRGIGQSYSICVRGPAGQSSTETCSCPLILELGNPAAA
jgi:hypothetical protein